jgi:4-hydroxybenzoate polyprenyltransferase
MTRLQQIKNAWRLTRPDQWSILTAQFLVSVMLTAPASRGGGCWFNPASAAVLAVAWLVWVVFLNGGTLAFNSAYDKDTGPVAYLADPPEPPSWLAPVALCFMLVGTILAWSVVGSAYALVVAFCVILSVLYSHPRSRLKAKPGLDLLVNMVGYGAGTTVAGLLAGQAAYFGADGNACAAGGWRFVAFPGLQGSAMQQFQASLAGGPGWIVLGFAMLFGSFYPLTQLYQVEEDLKRGDQTLCTKMGPRPALILAGILGIMAAVFFTLGLWSRGPGWSLVLPAAGLAAWTGHWGKWLAREPGLEALVREKKMYRALTLWAVVDATLVAAWYF